MPAIHVRDVPPALALALKRRAERNGRSMQKEVLAILEEAALGPQQPEPLPPLRLHTVRTMGTGTWTREEIYGDDGR